MKNVLMKGYYGKANFGDDVLMHVTYNVLRRAMPDANISILVDGNSSDYMRTVLKGITILRPGGHEHFDMIVHGGGGVFFDFGNYSALHQLIERAWRVIGFNTYLVVEKIARRIFNKTRLSADMRLGIGIGVGSFSPGSPRLRHNLSTLADFDTLWLRDAPSRGHLQQFEPIMGARIVQGSDIAFLTEYWLTAPVATRMPSARPRLGVILRDWDETHGGTSPAALQEILTQLAKDYDITGFIFDRQADQKLQQILAPYTTHIWQPNSMRIEEFSAKLSAQDVLLTSRFHGAICGACLNVPSVIVAIEPKLEEVHAMLPNASRIVSPRDTSQWPRAVKEALAITPTDIAADVEKNRTASVAALGAIERSISLPPQRKILMLQTQLGYGGAETSFIRLANFLAQSMDVRVALFSTKGKYDAGHEALNAPVVVLDTMRNAGYIIRWARRILRIRTLKKKHDVTISFLSGPNLVNAFSGRSSGSIVSLRGSRFYDPVAPKFQKLMFQYLIDPIVYHLAARIVPVSEGLTHEIRRVGGESVLKKVRVISPFVEAKAIARNLTQVPPEPYGALKGQKVIVAVGRLSLEKGFHHLIRVFGALARTHSGIKLLLVGDGPMVATLRAQCKDLGLVMDDVTPGVTSVLFAGYQKNVLPLMAVSSVYALTSATEGFPNVLLEALAAGLPVIAADAPWGARAILCDNPSSTSDPYPTTRVTEADYGVLMPRIDAPEYQEAWMQTLGDYLNNPRGAHPKAAKRVRDYDLAQVGEKWKHLIETIEAP